MQIFQHAIWKSSLNVKFCQRRCKGIIRWASILLLLQHRSTFQCNQLCHQPSAAQGESTESSRERHADYFILHQKLESSRSAAVLTLCGMVSMLCSCRAFQEALLMWSTSPVPVQCCPGGANPQGLWFVCFESSPWSEGASSGACFVFLGHFRLSVVLRDLCGIWRHLSEERSTCSVVIYHTCYGAVVNLSKIPHRSLKEPE